MEVTCVVSVTSEHVWVKSANSLVWKSDKCEYRGVKYIEVWSLKCEYNNCEVR